ncbi:hypothetical protein NKJ73_32120 [Mesorhizobium sp. M0074]|uniref:group II intron maturase-specific domain-containing protein n=1 Tax=unclassified Mesorhizobium TaxID=325217 RepID=UPI00333C4DC5
MRAQLNRVLLGWSTYFCDGTRAPAYEAVDRHVHDRVSNFLRKRHKLQRRGTSQVSRESLSRRRPVAPPPPAGDHSMRLRSSQIRRQISPAHSPQDGVLVTLTVIMYAMLRDGTLFEA